MRLLDAETEITEDMDGLVRTATQVLPQDFLDWCRETKDASSQRSKDFHLAVSIPTIFAEKWAREGFNIHKASLKEIRKRLHAEGLDHFDLSRKRL